MKTNHWIIICVCLCASVGLAQSTRPTTGPTTFPTHLVKGTHATSQPVILIPAEGTPLDTPSLTGEGGTALAGMIGGSYLEVLHAGPGVIIGGGRGNKVENLTIAGTGQHKDNRWTPPCGVLIDPGGAGVPIERRYAGLDHLYARNLAKSAGVKLRELSIYGFPVGLVIDPSGEDMMGSEVAVRDVNLINCGVGLSLCKTQSMNVVARDLHALNVDHVISTLHHGLRNAPPPRVQDGNFTGCKNLFVIGAGRGPFYVTDLYGEDDENLGVFGTTYTPAAQLARLTNLQLSFRHYENAPQSDAQSFSTRPMEIVGSVFSAHIPLRFANHNKLTFNRCHFVYHPDFYPPDHPDFKAWRDFITWNGKYAGDVEFIDCLVSNGSAPAVRITGKGGYTPQRLALATYIFPRANGTAVITLPTSAPSVKLGDVVYSDGTFLNVPDPVSGEPIGGQYLGMIGRVRAINGKQITLDCLPRSLKAGFIRDLILRKYEWQ